MRPAASFHDLLIVDLTAEEIDGPGLVRSMREQGELDAVPTLGYYSHVDQETRKRAEEAGISRVVPRSRMARETAALVEGLLPQGLSAPPSRARGGWASLPRMAGRAVRAVLACALASARAAPAVALAAGFDDPAPADPG